MTTNTLLSNIVAPTSIVTLGATQTLTNKTLTSPTLNSATANNLVLTGTVTANNSTGSNGQVLTSTGTGVKWATTAGSSLATLSDVSLSSPQTSQVLTYNGAQWVNAAVGGSIASAVFAAGASSDLGLVTDSNVTHSEDLGLITDTPPALYYDLSILQVQGVVALSNLDSSVRTDYIGYSIIFGF